MIYLLIPAKEDKKRSVLLRSHSLLGYSVFLMLFILSTSVLTYPLTNILGFATNISQGDLLKHTNERRKDAGLTDLKISSKLNTAAQKKAEDMFTHDYWAHTSPSGKEPWDFIRSAGYQYTFAGENLAVDFANSKSVVNAWYNSPSHKSNLLSQNYTEVGFAIVNGELHGRKTTLVVQMFGQPKNVPIIENSGVPEISKITDDVVVEESYLSQPEEVPVETVILDQINIAEDLPTQSFITDQGSVLNSSDVFSASRYIALILGLFLTGLFLIDGYYAKVSGVFRVSGHTALHVLLLVFAILGIWYTNVGLVL